MSFGTGTSCLEARYRSFDMPGASDSCYHRAMRTSWTVHRRGAKQIFEAAYLAHLLGKRRRGKGDEPEPVPV
ncbi:MAG: hypothetical protein JWO25_680, partial [Alphaproteobacteria bacterium]|nr:hypothetical protein [Alphaproteobacteria bacterium]